VKNGNIGRNGSETVVDFLVDVVGKKTIDSHFITSPSFESVFIDQNLMNFQKYPLG
jgi:hypothetical protein